MTRLSGTIPIARPAAPTPCATPERSAGHMAGSPFAFATQRTRIARSGTFGNMAHSTQHA
ncbi:hypothetical protein C7S13_2990 [Burkholderia cepacia]|nr:hypothetical protein [Burkholderia cepacia]